MNDNYLKYTITIDDLIAFNMYHVKNSPTVRRNFYILQICVAGTIFVFFLCQAILQRKLSPLIGGFFGALFGYIFFTCFLTLTYSLGIKTTTTKMFKEGSAKGILGEHILELTDTEIIERTSVNELKTMISFLERVETTSEYAFIYISSLQAHLIPRSSIIEGNLDNFLQELNRKIEEKSQ